jgi:hypothetical protein
MESVEASARAGEKVRALRQEILHGLGLTKEAGAS